LFLYFKNIIKKIFILFYFIYFILNKVFLIFLDYFDVLISKIYYFNIFLNKKTTAISLLIIFLKIKHVFSHPIAGL
jgi:hypothetical protein